MAAGNISGLASGINWNETVDLLMQLERRPVDSLQSRKSTFQSQLTHWNSIEAKLSTLKGAADEINTLDKLLVKSSSSSNSDVLAVSASASANTGTHQVLVNQLASHHIHIHTAGWIDLDTTAVNTHGEERSFSYQYGEEVRTVNVPNNSTLRDLVNLINRDPDNLGVTASVLNSGSGTETPFHLVLSGKNTGEEFSITIINTEENPTDIGVDDEFDVSEWDVTQTAKNAEIRVDGFPNPDWGWPNPWIESSSNIITDVIPGVTLNLKNVSDGELVNVEVSLDTSGITEKVNKLVTTYNDIINHISVLSRRDAETETSGPLFGDPLARSIVTELRNMLAQTLPGTSDEDKFNSLRQIGLSISEIGNLQLDNKKFQDALNEDTIAVARLLSFDAVSSSPFVSYSSHNNRSVGGEHAFTVYYNEDGTIDKTAGNLFGGESPSIHGTSLFQGASGSDVEGLLMGFTNPGDGPGSIEGTVRVYTGFAVMLSRTIERISHAEDGTLAISKNRIKDSVKMLDARIERWEDRLKSIEEGFKRQYSSMEMLISQMQSQGNYLQSVL